MLKKNYSRELEESKTKFEIAPDRPSSLTTIFYPEQVYLHTYKILTFFTLFKAFSWYSRITLVANSET